MPSVIYMITIPFYSLKASQKVFSDILSIFNTNEMELTIEASKEAIAVKNYIEPLKSQTMRTQLSLK